MIPKTKTKIRIRQIKLGEKTCLSLVRRGHDRVGVVDKENDSKDKENNSLWIIFFKDEENDSYDKENWRNS